MTRKVHLRRSRRADTEPSELAHFLEPVAQSFRWAATHAILCAAVVGALYAGSGITTLEPNQSGLILRLGALVGASTNAAVRDPGLVLAWPRPFDDVIRVNATQINTLNIDALRPAEDGHLADNYVLTADRNILHLGIRVRYTIGDPVLHALYTTDHEATLENAVLSAVVAQSGGMSLDAVLGRERARFLSASRVNAQARAESTGLHIISIEFNDLGPPQTVVAAFDAVQSANIAARTEVEQARAYAAERALVARAEGQRIETEASAHADAILGAARGQAAAFVELARVFRASPTVMTERLYRETMEHAFSRAADVTFVPPHGPSVHISVTGAKRLPPFPEPKDE